MNKVLNEYPFSYIVSVHIENLINTYGRGAVLCLEGDMASLLIIERAIQNMKATYGWELVEEILSLFKGG